MTIGAYELDPVRAPMNEGGLLAERQGWHLPGYKAKSSDGWTDGSPLDGLNKSGMDQYPSHPLLLAARCCPCLIQSNRGRLLPYHLHP